MLMRETKLIDRAGNWAVVQVEGRRFPAICIQGDTYASLVKLIEGVQGQLGDDLEELRDELLAIRMYYEDVLRRTDREIPY
ncbi:hypothetical protein AB0C42_15645 [Micromonospora taraxaci]